jgi:two-component system chemotaxis response regulator CheY
MASEDEKLKAARILIVDDDADVRTIARLSLQKSGFTAVETTDRPMIAINKIEWGKTDLVLLDWRMPEVKGIDILRNVRQTNKLIPIIMLTAEDRMENVREAIGAGATDYIVKPWSTPILVEKVLNALRNRKTNDDLVEW